jgi:hypothetical protein
MHATHQKTQAVALRQDLQVLPLDFTRRIDLCKDTFRSNCIGTAMYIVGEQQNDTTLSTKTSYGLYLRTLKSIQDPVVGCVAAWVWRAEWWLNPSRTRIIENNIEIFHMGVVTSSDPLLITHRKSSNGQFIIKTIDNARY